MLTVAECHCRLETFVVSLRINNAKLITVLGQALEDTGC